MKRTLATLGLLLSLGTGCGDDAGGVGNDDAGLDQAVTCEDACAFEQECGTEDSLDDCLATCECMAPLFRPDFQARIWSCLTESCDESEDACFTRVAEELGGTPASDAFESACRTRSAECAASLSEDYCFGTPLSDAALEDLEPCLALECADAADCIAGVVGVCK